MQALENQVAMTDAPGLLPSMPNTPMLVAVVSPRDRTGAVQVTKYLSRPSR